MEVKKKKGGGREEAPTGQSRLVFFTSFSSASSPCLFVSLIPVHFLSFFSLFSVWFLCLACSGCVFLRPLSVSASRLRSFFTALSTLFVSLPLSQFQVVFTPLFLSPQPANRILFPFFLRCVRVGYSYSNRVGIGGCGEPPPRGASLPFRFRSGAGNRSADSGSRCGEGRWVGEEGKETGKKTKRENEKRKGGRKENEAKRKGERRK